MRRSFHIRPYDPNRVSKPRSDAQKAATERNFRIGRLRGLWYLNGLLSPARREAVEAIIDAELRDLGAEPEGERRRRRRADLMAEIAARREADTAIPF